METDSAFLKWGAFNVEAGTLLVENTSGSATGSGLLTIYADAVLAGTGYITAETVLAAGASLAPGSVDANGISVAGTLTANTLTWNSDDVNAGLCMQISSESSSSDMLVLTGALTKGSGTDFIIDFSGSELTESIVYTLITFDSTDFTADDFVALNANGIFEITNNSLTFTAIPEPSSSITLGGVLVILGIVGMRRRRS